MTAFTKLKIPTLLGLGILLLGIITGTYLVLRDQVFYTKASPNLIPQNITLTNIDDNSITISWQTSSATPSFIIYGTTSANEQATLDDRDANKPNNYTIHHITLKNLLPKTTYLYKIVSGKYTSETLKFTTASPASSQNGFNPVIGSVLDGDKPLNDGVAYLSVSGAVVQSATIKNFGNFIIPISFLRKIDLSDAFPLEKGAMAKITIKSDKGDASVLFKLESSAKPLPPIRLGQNLDFTTLDLKASVAIQSEKELSKLDLNGDGLINTADYAIILKNIGKKPSGKQDPLDEKADLNSDGVIDQKDLDLLSKKLTNK